MKIGHVLMSAAFLGLAGCDAPRLIYANNQQPTPAIDPVINYVLIDNNDRGLIAASMDTSALPEGELVGVTMSPDARLVAAQYIEQTTVLEAIVAIYETGSGAPVFSFTDNNIITDLEALCLSTPNLVATQASVDADIAAGAFPPTTIVELIFFGSPPENEVVFEGWTGDDSFRAIANVVTGVEIIDSATGNVIVASGPTVLESMVLHFERPSTGYAATACDGALPAIITPSAVRAVSISGSGELLIDGAVMENSAAPGTPLASDPVEELSGPWPLDG